MKVKKLWNKVFHKKEECKFFWGPPKACMRDVYLAYESGEPRSGPIGLPVCKEVCEDFESKRKNRVLK